MYIHTVSVQFHINMQNMDVICIQGITPQIKLRIPIVSMKEFRIFSVYGKMVGSISPQNAHKFIKGSWEFASVRQCLYRTSNKISGNRITIAGYFIEIRNISL